MAKLSTWVGEDAVLSKSIFGTARWEEAAQMIEGWLKSQYGQAGRVLSIERSVGAAVPVLMNGDKKFAFRVEFENVRYSACSSHD